MVGDMTMRRVAVATGGFGVLLLGLALVVVPVPGISVFMFALGLAILGKEFDWARRLLAGAKSAMGRLWTAVRRAFGASPLPLPLPVSA